MSRRPSDAQALGLRAGDLVEIRSEGEILATLDGTGALDALPFMPEMLAYCGQRIRVYKRADKTCDTIAKSGGRRMMNTVHLADMRCNGQAHGGCQAGCLLFWKEAWLKRVPDGRSRPRANGAGPGMPEQPAFDRVRLLKATHVDGADSKAEPRYRCQATDLRRASSPLAWWDLRQYVRDVRSGNVDLRAVMGAFGFWLFQQFLKIGGQRALIWLYDEFQRRRGGIAYPFKGGSLDKTPRATLDLREGDCVQVRSYDEILRTVNAENRNRGLRFDAEMVPYCEGTYRVLRRVERLIDETTGRMVKLSNDCVILDGVVCQSRFSARRVFCPRSIFSYWREIWLKRVDDASTT